MKIGTVKTTIEGVNPETNEKFEHTVESEVVATVAAKSGDKGVEITSMIMGGLSTRTSISMVKALTGMCKDILKNLDPLSAMLLMHELMNDEEGEEDGMAGTGSESEGSVEQ